MKLIKIFLIFILTFFVLVNFQSYVFAGGNIEEIEIEKDSSDVKKIVFLDTSIDIANSTVEKLVKAEVKHKLKKYLMDRHYYVFASDNRSNFKKYIKDNEGNEYFVLTTNIIIECTYDVYRVINEFDIISSFLDKDTQKKIKKHGKDVYRVKIKLDGFVINSLSSVSGDLVISEKEEIENISDYCTQIIVSSYRKYLSRNTPAKNWIRDKINEKVDLNLDKIFN